MNQFLPQSVIPTFRCREEIISRALKYKSARGQTSVARSIRIVAVLDEDSKFLAAEQSYPMSQ